MTDVVQLNRGSGVARVTGTCLVAAGILGVAAFLWYTVRNQQHLEYSPFSDLDEDGDPSLLDRIDVFTGTVSYLMFAVIPVGLGIGLRVFANERTRSADRSEQGPAAGVVEEPVDP
jgi:nitrogen fixation-related uncharacterized protein